MENIKELYNDVILFHCKAPRNFKRLEVIDTEKEGHNPLCGDHFMLYLQFEGDVIKDIGFQDVAAKEGGSCCISRASASMMTSAVKGKSKGEVLILSDEFHRLAENDLRPDSDSHHLGNIGTAFANIHKQKFSGRVKCATLPWKTLYAALEGRSESVTTEDEHRQD
jgi:nitrogen fixation NifU-like protein